MNRKLMLTTLICFSMSSFVIAAADTYTSSFKDVPKHYWANTSITAVTKEGLMSGYKDDTFRPDKPLSREEAASLFSKIIGDTPKVILSTRFADITSDRWSAQAIQSVAEKNIISGYGDNTYRPEQYMSRQEFAVVVDKYLHYRGYKTEDPTVLDNIHYSDQKFIAPWAQHSVRELAYLGFIQYNPNNLFNPEKYISRGEAAEISYRLLYTKEASQFTELLVRQDTEDTARKLIFRALGKDFDLHTKGAMFWRDDKLVISMKSVNDVKSLGATMAFTNNKNVFNNIIITNGAFSLNDFDALQTEAAYLYHELVPQGTVLDVTPTPNVDGLVFTVNNLDPKTIKAFHKKFGKKIQIKMPEK